MCRPYYREITQLKTCVNGLAWFFVLLKAPGEHSLQLQRFRFLLSGAFEGVRLVFAALFLIAEEQACVWTPLFGGIGLL